MCIHSRKIEFVGDAGDCNVAVEIDGDLRGKVSLKAGTAWPLDSTSLRRWPKVGREIKRCRRHRGIDDRDEHIPGTLVSRGVLQRVDQWEIGHRGSPDDIQSTVVSDVNMTRPFEAGSTTVVTAKA